ncbi:MAG: hypothetical protein P1S59_03165 [bacterium]|nr:hypothetical protein [bacterium]
MDKLIIRSLIAAALAVLLISITGGSVYATGYDEHDQSGQPEYLYNIEGTGSYFLPGTDEDIFFNLGKWYRNSGGSWSMSGNFDGPWSGIMTKSVPAALADLPSDFRTTRRLGMIPYRYVIGPDKWDDNDVYRYYRGEYYRDYERHGYRRQWHPRGKFWFFVAPDFHDDDWGDDNHRRRRKGRY